MTWEVLVSGHVTDLSDIFTRDGGVTLGHNLCFL
jgi:hypothetical protein